MDRCWSTDSGKYLFSFPRFAWERTFAASRRRLGDRGLLLRRDGGGCRAGTVFVGAGHGWIRSPGRDTKTQTVDWVLWGLSSRRLDYSSAPGYYLGVSSGSVPIHLGLDVGAPFVSRANADALQQSHSLVALFSALGATRQVKQKDNGETYEAVTLFDAGHGGQCVERICAKPFA